MTRTPPPVQPNGYEKSSREFKFYCTPSERFLWRSVFGGRKLSETIRNYLNREAARRLRKQRT